MAGRKRKHNPLIPIHIDQAKLPSGVYWDNSGSGRWYTTFRDDETGKQKTRTIAQRKATLADLHKIMEEMSGQPKDTLNTLIKAFQGSIQYKQVSIETRKKYDYGLSMAAEFPAKNGKPLGVADIRKFTAKTIQKLIDSIAVQRGPTAARHCLRALTRAFRWGNGRGICSTEAVTAIELPKERKQRVLPDLDAYNKVIMFAQERGKLKTTQKGSVPEYLWCVIEIAYLCRLRGIEVITLTDANETERGVITNRRKGSRDNVVLWTPRLRAAWDAAKLIRNQRRLKWRLPTSTMPERCYLFVNNDNAHIRRDTLGQAMDRLMKEAIDANVIEKEQRFTLHPVKRRGVTDTKGNRADKQTASGHKDQKMLDIYDMELPEVPTSER